MSVQVPAIKAIIILPSEQNEKTLYLLLEDFTFNGITVPKGFVTDGATIPRIFWPILPPVDKYMPAAIVHDYMLTQTSRREADTLFNDTLKLLRIKRYRRWLMYGAVRIFAHWKKLVTKVKGLYSSK